MPACFPYEVKYVSTLSKQNRKIQKNIEIMKIEEKTILWKPVSEYTGGRVLATNGLDILVGELNPEGDCVSEDCSSRPRYCG